MAIDLTFANLNTALGTNAITAVGSVISIDCNLLMGEATIALADAKVAEFMTNLMDIAAEAETTLNANPANVTKLASYPQPVSGVPFIDSTDNNFYVSATYSFTSRSPLNKAATTAVTA